ncbi:hypothetical protein CTAYLR_000430 [Chrysophaeum taylorii]|uniref:CUE domain-containing protein n=1 Tax=Chrysophaeum taylorii TaxID=2483200 RepID=A0AAD7XQI1_9STRA|nr:hypothetical protein CTAYLR_000430 [Chrysophaeum taylorii]
MAAICPTPSHQSRKRSALFDDPFCHKRLNRSGVEFGAQALLRLRAHFPGMDDEALKNVLDSCAHDIDAAIEKLTSLRVSQLAEEEEQAKRHRRDSPPPKSSPHSPQSPEDWVEAFVGEMQQSRDVADAKHRAARALTAFEAFVSARAADKVNRLDRENLVLKRAVAIQAQRLAEARDDKQRDAHLISQLKKQADDQNEKLKQAQLSNYSLSVHLRRATDSHGFAGTGGFHPDVF